MHDTAQRLEITATSTTVPTPRLISVMGAQSARMIRALDLLDAAGWERGTRCAAWNVRQLVQHLVTAAERAVQLLDADLGPTRSLFTAMDPRLTPLEWLAADGEATPASLVARYRAVRDELLARASALADRQVRFTVDGPIGRIPWELFLLHGLWDAWIHERDAALVDPAPVPVDDLELELVGTYALYIAVEAARLGGRRLSAGVCLDGPGGGTWIIDASTTTSVRRLAGVGGTGRAGDGRAGADGGELPVVSGPAIEVFEALSGRGEPLASIVVGDAELVTALSALATFFASGD